jgi:energy-coupling factor transport system ATP-binding protein
MIVFDKVYFSYSNHLGENIPALKGINLSVVEGESLLILGGNGSGKTTLLKLARGLLMPTKGTVRIQGLDTNDPRSELSHLVSYILSRPGDMIFSPIVEEDVAFGLECRGLPSEEICSRVNHSLKMLGLTELRKNQTHQMSGGEQQKVALAGALAHDPKILLLDEPTAYLDSGQSRRILKQVQQLKNPITILLTTQRPDPMFQPDRILVLHKGRSLFCGPPADLLNQPEILTLAGLIPSKSLLLGKRLYKKGIPLKNPYHTPEQLIKQLCKLWYQISAISAVKAQ